MRSDSVFARLALVVFLLIPLAAGLLRADQPASAPASAPCMPATATIEAVPATQPTSAPATSQPAPLSAADAETLRQTAVDDALAGRFDQAAETLRRLRAAQPAGSDDDETLDLLQQYFARTRQADEERQVEYEEAVLRIRRSMLAQDYLPRLKEDRIAKPLREAVLKVGSNYAEAAGADALEMAADEEAQQLKVDTAKSLAAAVEALDEAQAILPEENGEYVASFHRAAAAVCSQLRKYRDAWGEVQVDTLKGRLDAADRLRTLEDDLTRAVGDLEVLVTSKPWRVGLIQAQVARDLYEGDQALSELDWYRRIKELGENQGRTAAEEGRWFDALGAYAGLSELEPDNEAYKERVKTIRRHVRVLGLYAGLSFDQQDDGEMPVEDESAEPTPDGDGLSSEDTDEPAAEQEDDDLGWEDVVAGVDANMVRNAISQMEQYYVTAVDYRKVGLGALDSVEVLARTEQIAEVFPGLADEQARNRFLAAVGEIRQFIEKKDRLDHIDLQTAFNSILAASDRSVKIPLEVLAVEFTEGMLDELDRFSSMIWPYDVSDFQKETMGKFFGVGIQITKEPGEPLKVVSPLPGSPAHRQGIKTDDLILAVDGRRTEDLSTDKLVRMITGERGTTVVLTIKRAGMLQPKDYTIVREEIRIRTVKGWRQFDDGEWDYMIDPVHGIGYIRITQFTDQTFIDVDAALADLRDAGLRSLVLDMRWNPGGLMRPATKVVDEFLADGRVVSTKGRPTPPTEITAEAGGKYLDGDLIVLVNEYSASAAEIVSGALKDWRRGIIVGERTFGKGSVQNVIPIPYKDAFLKLTTAYYYLPFGRLLHRRNGDEVWGVDPDVKVTLTPRQTKRWLDIRRKTDLIQDIDPDELTAELAEQFDADIQLRTAVMMLRLLQLQEVSPAAEPSAAQFVAG